MFFSKNQRLMETALLWREYLDIAEAGIAKQIRHLAFQNRAVLAGEMLDLPIATDFRGHVDVIGVAPLVMPVPDFVEDSSPAAVAREVGRHDRGMRWQHGIIVANPCEKHASR